MAEKDRMDERFAGEAEDFIITKSSEGDKDGEE